MGFYLEVHTELLVGIDSHCAVDVSVNSGVTVSALCVSRFVCLLMPTEPLLPYCDCLLEQDADCWKTCHSLFLSNQGWVSLSIPVPTPEFQCF